MVISLTTILHADQMVGINRGSAYFQLPEKVRVVEEKIFEMGERKHFEANFPDLETFIKGVCEVRKNEFQDLDSYKKYVAKNSANLFTGQIGQQSDFGDSFAHMWINSSPPETWMAVRYSGIEKGLRFELSFIVHSKNSGIQDPVLKLINTVSSSLVIGAKHFSRPILTLNQGEIMLPQSLTPSPQVQSPNRDPSPEPASPASSSDKKTVRITPEAETGSSFSWFFYLGSGTVLMVIGATAFYLRKKRGRLQI